MTSETSTREFIPPAKPIIGADERAAVDAVLATGQVASGPEVAAFEREFGEQLVAGRTCVAVNSGTSGLHLGLLAAGVGPGDEVIVPSFTFAATANAVALTGATPVFVDIEPTYFCLDPQAVEAAITERTKAIMPVHLFGHPADMTELGAVAQRHGVALYEDAAQAHGATWQGTPVGAFGSFAMFSLYPTKNMTSGEGGMVSCADDHLARQVRLLRNQGMERQYANEVIGLNNRMTDIHAAIGRVQLRKLAEWTQTRQRNAAYLSEHLEGVTVPRVADGATHVYHQYTIRVAAGRDEVVRRLREEFQVGSGVYYPIPNHRLDSLARFAPGLDLPETEVAAREVLSLPVHPSLSADDLDRIVGAVNTVAGSGGVMPGHTEDLRIGLIGLGAMGRHHARVIRSTPGLRLVAVADPVGDRFGVAGDLPVLPDVQALIDAGVDGVMVAVPTVLHEEVALTLAGAGVHAMVEKPIAHSVEAGQRVARAFDEAGLVGAVGYVERCNPAMIALRERIASGLLGEVYQVTTSRQGPFPERINDVGVVQDLATHDVDLTPWLVGSRYTSVTAHVTYRSGREHEDMLVASGRLENGVIVNHLVNWLSPRKERHCVVTGEKGALVADTLTGDLTYYENGTLRTEWDALASFRGVAEGDVTRFALHKVEPLAVEHQGFRDALRGETSANIVPMTEGVETLRVVDACLRSAREGVSVTL